MGTTLLPRPNGALQLVRRAMSFSVCGLTVAVLANCGAANNFLTPASFENVDRQYSLYALTGTSSSLPAAYQFTTESIVRPQVLNTGALNFDVALDLDASGKVTVMTAKKIVPLPPAGAPTVGLLKLTAVYDQLAIAPDKGYVNDSTVTLAIGEAVLVRLTRSGCIYGEPIYAKFAIDSIDTVARRILVRSLVNRNCGYRSLKAGVPAN